MAIYLYRSIKYVSPMVYRYNSQIRPKIDYYCHIWIGAVSPSLSSIDGVQKRLRGLEGYELIFIFQTFSPRKNAIFMPSV